MKKVNEVEKNPDVTEDKTHKTEEEENIVKDKVGKEEKDSDKVEEKKVEAQALKKPRLWREIISSTEYVQAKTTGKILSFVTYGSHEEADNNEKYFLMKITNHASKNDVSASDEYVYRMEMEDNETKFLNLMFDDQYPLWCEKEEFPFYFFSDNNVSSEEDLNFNRLQSCNNVYDAFKKDTYVVVFVDKLSSSGPDNKRDVTKKFIEWQKNKPNIKIRLFLDLKKAEIGKFIEIEGQMLQIFNKEYPEITIQKQS